MSLQYLLARKRLLLLARGMGGDLCGAWAADAASLHLIFDLLRPKTRRIQVRLRIAFDLWRTTSACLDFVAKAAQPVHQFGLIDRYSELFTFKE
jgi:hypothetical protein